MVYSYRNSGKSSWWWNRNNGKRSNSWQLENVDRKKNRAGGRFGFVKFSNIIDAERAIERLNGFYLYSFRLMVSVARFKTRTTFWRKVNRSRTQQKQQKVLEESNKSNLKEAGNNSISFKQKEVASSSQEKWSEGLE
ncbi:hypothetical protein V6N13_015293 [Hibiscus sabdariffa]